MMKQASSHEEKCSVTQSRVKTRSFQSTNDRYCVRSLLPSSLVNKHDTNQQRPTEDVASTAEIGGAETSIT